MVNSAGQACRSVGVNLAVNSAAAQFLDLSSRHACNTYFRPDSSRQTLLFKKHENKNENLAAVIDRLTPPAAQQKRVVPWSAPELTAGRVDRVCRLLELSGRRALAPPARVSARARAPAARADTTRRRGRVGGLLRRRARAVATHLGARTCGRWACGSAARRRWGRRGWRGGARRRVARGCLRADARAGGRTGAKQAGSREVKRGRKCLSQGASRGDVGRGGSSEAPLPNRRSGVGSAQI